MHEDDLYIEHPELESKDDHDEFFGGRLSNEDEPLRFKNQKKFEKFRKIMMKSEYPISGETESKINITEKELQYCPFSHLKSTCLRNFISTDGIEDGDYKSIHALILKNTGKVIKAPTWYKPPQIKYGPRRIGLKKCGRDKCPRTENETDHFKACGGCHVPFYCSKECQVADWKFRHKIVCKKSKEERDEVKLFASAFGNAIDMFSKK
jgi:hypothetical protein